MVCCCIGKLKGCTCAGRCNCECTCGRPVDLNPKFIQIEQLWRESGIEPCHELWCPICRDDVSLVPGLGGGKGVPGPCHEYWCPISMNEAGCEDECSCRDIPDASYLFNDIEENRMYPNDGPGKA